MSISEIQRMVEEQTTPEGIGGGADEAWRKFKSVNPFYMKGKDAWMKSRGYI